MHSLKQFLVCPEKVVFRPGPGQLELFCIRCKKTNIHEFIKSGYVPSLFYCTGCEGRYFAGGFNNVYGTRFLRLSGLATADNKYRSDSISFENARSKYKVLVMYSKNNGGYYEHFRKSVRFEDANSFLENYFILQ